jgi:hypothetical protein
MHKPFDGLLQTLFARASVSCGAKKDGSLIIIYPMDCITLLREIAANLGSYKS